MVKGLTQQEIAEYTRLYAQMTSASAAAAQIMQLHGMASREYRGAEDKSAAILQRMFELQAKSERALIA